MSSASSSTLTPALMRRTLAWLSTSLFRGMSRDALNTILVMRFSATGGREPLSCPSARQRSLPSSLPFHPRTGPEIGWQVRRLGRGQVRIIRSASPSGVAFPLPRAARRNSLQNGREVRVRAKALGENGEAVAAYTGALAAGEAHHHERIVPQAPVWGVS